MTDRNKHPNQFDEAFGNAILKAAQEGLVVLDGDKVKITEKGRMALAEAEKND